MTGREKRSSVSSMRAALELGSIEVLKRFVEIGMGIALVTRVAVAEEVQNRRLLAIEVRGLASHSIELVEHRGRRRSPVTAAFVELLKEEVSGQKR